MATRKPLRLKDVVQKNRMRPGPPTWFELLKKEHQPQVREWLEQWMADPTVCNQAELARCITEHTGRHVTRINVRDEIRRIVDEANGGYTQIADHDPR